MATNDPFPSIETASVYVALSMRPIETGTATGQNRNAASERTGRDEIRASLAGALRSPEITETYIEKLKARAEEQAANRRALRSRVQVDGMGAKASIDLTALKTSPESTAANAGQNAQIEAARDAYRSNSGHSDAA